MALQEHHSLVLQNITPGSYDVIYKAEGYHDAGFEITVIPMGDNRFTYDLVPLAQGEIWLQSPETKMPTEIYLEDPAPFTFYISNTGGLDVEYAIRIEFESVDLPDPITLLFPRSDSELIWSSKIPAGAYTVNYATATLPSEAIPEGMDEATYDVYVHLLAR